MRRAHLRWLATLAAVISLYALAGFVGMPRFVQHEVTRVFAETYGRDARLDHARFNPFTLEFEATGFSVAGAAAGPELAFERLYINFELASLWNRAWTFRGIALDQPYARLVRHRDGSINLVELFTRAAGASAPADQPAALPPLRIGAFQVDRGRIDFTDETTEQPFSTSLAPISFELDDFRTEGNANSFRLVSGSDLGAGFDFAGSLALDPVAARATLHLSRAPVTAFGDYLGSLLPIGLRAGEVDLQMDFAVAIPASGLAANFDVSRLSLSGLELLGAGQDSAWIFPSILVADTHIDLVARSVEIGSIEVREPVMPVWRNSDGLVAPGLQPAATASQPAVALPMEGEQPAGSAPTWRVSIPSITIEDASVPFEDRTLEPAAALGIAVTQLTIEGFSQPATGPVTATATIESAAGGQLESRATVSAGRDALTADWRVAGLELAPAQAYLDRDTDLLLDRGRVSGAGQLEVDGLGRHPRVEVAGDLRIDGLHTRDRTLKQDFIKWKSLSLTQLSYGSSPASLSIKEVVAEEPYVRLILAASGVTNIESVLDPAAAAAKARQLASERTGALDAVARGDGAGAATAATATTAPQPTMSTRIATVRVNAGELAFADYTLEPNFAIAVEQLQGTVEGMSSAPGALSTVALKGEVDRYAPAEITGQMNLLAADSFLDIAASFRNIELTAFNPYSGKFAGYRIDKGKLSIETRYKLDERRLEANHNIVINQLQLGDKVASPDAVSLPLKLAIALLKDSNSVIELDLPVSGSLDDPQFKLGPIIWKALLGLLTKAVTAPFALLGSLFGGGEDLSYVTFTPGSAGLDDAMTTKVDALRSALIARPALNLDIPATAVTGLDAQALTGQRLQQALQAVGKEPPASGTGQAWQSDRPEYLRRLKLLYRSDTGVRAQIPEPPAATDHQPGVDPVEHEIAWLERALIASRVPTADEIEALGQARATAVRDLLLADGAVDPSRVFIVRGDEAAGDEPPGEDAGVRMTLSLK